MYLLYSLLTSLEHSSFLEVNVIKWFHLLCVCVSIRISQGRVSFLQSFLSVILSGFAGSFLIGILLGQPATFLMEEAPLKVACLCYVVVFLFPSDLVFAVVSNKLVWAVVHPIVDAFSVSFAVIGWINLMLHLHASEDSHASLANFNSHGVTTFAGIFFVASLCADAGSLLPSAFSLQEKEWKFQTPVILKLPFPFGLFPSVFGSFIYTFVAFCPEAACFPSSLSSELNLLHAYFDYSSLVKQSSPFLNLKFAKLVVILVVFSLKLAQHWFVSDPSHLVLSDTTSSDVAPVKAIEFIRPTTRHEGGKKKSKKNK